MPAKQILLIEDNITLAFGLEASLKSRGFGVQRVMNGEDAFTVCSQCMPDLIVTDMMMRRMDGFTFLTRLREMPAGKAVPVVVISGLADPESLKEIRSLGVQQVLVKPFGLDRFLGAVLESIQNGTDKYAPES